MKTTPDKSATKAVAGYAIRYASNNGLRTPVERVMKCTHRRRHEKSYVGSLETYFYCPDCLETWGGEETPAKKALIASAARAQVTEQDEVEG